MFLALQITLKPALKDVPAGLTPDSLEALQPSVQSWSPSALVLAGKPLSPPTVSKWLSALQVEADPIPFWRKAVFIFPAA